MTGLWLRLAWRELVNSRRFAAFFILNLTLGLTGFIALDVFKVSVENSLHDRSKALLGADLQVESNRRLTSSEDRIISEVIGQKFQRAEMIEMYTMAAGPMGSRLIQLRAIDNLFPFYGDLELETKGIAQSGQDRSINHNKAAWLYPELIVQLGSPVGSLIKIGTENFQVDGILKNDSSASAQAASFAPRIYLGLHQIEQTGLIQLGSRVTYSYLYKLQEAEAGEDLPKKISQKLADPTIKVLTSRSASQQISRALNYLNDFLGLVALSALFLSGIGGAYLFRSHLERRFKEIAILCTLGATHRNARMIYTSQLMILGGLAAIFSTVLASTLLPLIPQILSALLPKDFHLAFSWPSVAMAFVVGVFGSLASCLPMLHRISALKPAVLFQENRQEGLEFSWKSGVYYIPSLVLYYVIAIALAHSYKIGSIFIGSFLGAGIVLTLTGIFLLEGLGKLVQRFGKSWPFVLKFAIRSIIRNRLAAISVFLAMALGAVLVNTIFLLQKSLNSEMSQPNALGLPSLFLFDIQDDQVEDLSKYLASSGITLESLSPMVRARLDLLNGQPFSRQTESGQVITREDEREQFFRNRSFNLSSRAGLSTAETIVKGRPFSGVFNEASGKLPEISVEEQFAKRLNFKIGDVLAFEIQGVELKGEIVNLRKVRWISFRPNFFVQFQDGVLTDAPKTFVASIANIAKENKPEIQNGIVQSFANISVVDVSSTVEKVLFILNQITWSIKFMAVQCMIVGLMVLLSVANHQAWQRQREIQLLKVLGARFQTIRLIFLWEFGLIALAAAVFGSLFSIGVSYILAVFQFDEIYTISYGFLATSLVTLLIVSIILVYFAINRSLLSKPLQLLKGD
jgi:putative ABC transport system permease protein